MKPCLAGWSYQTARLTAANFVKGETRRQLREQEAYILSTLNESDPAAWQQIAPLLDDAMGDLGDTGCNAVVLRFFENKTAQEVGVALRQTEAAAHKRVTRALEKLRKFFNKRGVMMTATFIAGAMSAKSVQAAPVSLAATVTAVAAKGTLISATIATLVKGTMKSMTWIKLKFAAGVRILVMVGGGLVTVAFAGDGVAQPEKADVAHSDHSTYLRGLINLPELKAALLEVNHSLVNSSRPPTVFTMTRLVKTGETFVDQTIKGDHIQFEIIEINVGRQTVRLRENGKEIVCGFETGDSPSTNSINSLSEKFGVRLQAVRFVDAMDLYSDMKDRTLLIHPAVIGALFSFETLAADKSKFVESLEKEFRTRNIQPIPDGKKFIILAPDHIITVPRSMELDANSPIYGSLLCHGPLRDLVTQYAALLGLTQIGSERVVGGWVYLRTKNLSKAEMSYACGTLLEWSGFKIVVVDDKTFKVVRKPTE